MVEQYQRELNKKKNLIISDLNSKETSLIAKVKQNPRTWNNESLHFNMKIKTPEEVFSAINLDVIINQVGFR